MGRKFDTGTLVMTKGVLDKFCSNNYDFFKLVVESFVRYKKGDWGDLCDEDKQQNERAIKNGDRLMGSYRNETDHIWIITEWDRSVTTILFPDEY